MRLATLVALCAPLAILPLQAQTASAPPVVSSLRFVPGEMVERVASSLDRSQHYAVYLPSAYRTDRKWPVLLLLDPRGRALIPMGLARAAAERHGYMVLSSYNTLSDGSNQPNIDAMAAMLTDAQRHFSVDPGRLYLVGFSGTARIAWEFAYGMRGNIAGIIGFGAGVPPGFEFERPGQTGPLPFVYYGGCGDGDFNYEELLQLDQELDRWGVAHRLQFFEGPHSWPPARVMTDAIEWMELQAARKGLALKDSLWIDSLFTAGLERARTREDSGETYEAFLGYRALATDFAGLRDVSWAEGKAAGLEKSAPVRGVIRRQQEMIARNRIYLRKLGSFLADFRKAKSPPGVDRALKTLEIDRLKKRLADTSDRESALAAGRMLAQAAVFTSFYEPRDYLARQEPARALAMLAIAEAVRPRSSICYDRARALGMLQRQEEAVKALACWASQSRPDPDSLAADTDLAMLHGHPAFEALVARLKEGPILPAHP